MNQSKIDRLIIKLIENTISDQESDVLKAWLQDETHLDYFNDFIEINHLIVSKHRFDYKPSLESVKTSLDEKSRFKISNLYKYAAAVLIFISIGYVFLTKNKATEDNTPIIVNNTIKTGTDKATLTLEDGSSVVLGEGQQYISDKVVSNGKDLIYETSQINATKLKPSIAYNYLTIPRGGQYLVKLSDGTKVWLNSESQLKYPVHFIKGETRAVELVYGEAYFDVSPSTKHSGAKFKVLTGDQEVEVLGTEFNISAYQDEATIYTTLVEGKVAVTEGSTNTVLSPQQQSIIKKGIAGIEIVNADVYSITSWRKGIFSFDRMPLEKIMKVLARWYDIDVIFIDSDIKQDYFTGILRKNQSIEEILESIRTTNNIAYEINNNTVIFR